MTLHDDLADLYRWRCNLVMQRACGWLTADEYRAARADWEAVEADVSKRVLARLAMSSAALVAMWIERMRI